MKSEVAKGIGHGERTYSPKKMPIKSDSKWPALVVYPRHHRDGFRKGQTIKFSNFPPCIYTVRKFAN